MMMQQQQQQLGALADRTLTGAFYRNPEVGYQPIAQPATALSLSFCPIDGQGCLSQ